MIQSETWVHSTLHKAQPNSRVNQELSEPWLESGLSKIYWMLGLTTMGLALGFEIKPCVRFPVLLLGWGLCTPLYHWSWKSGGTGSFSFSPGLRKFQILSLVMGIGLAGGTSGFAQFWVLPWQTQPWISQAWVYSSFLSSIGKYLSLPWDALRWGSSDTDNNFIPAFFYAIFLFCLIKW